VPSQVSSGLPTISPKPVPLGVGTGSTSSEPTVPGVADQGSRRIVFVVRLCLVLFPVKPGFGESYGEVGSYPSEKVGSCKTKPP